MGRTHRCTIKIINRKFNEAYASLIVLVVVLTFIYSFDPQHHFSLTYTHAEQKDDLVADDGHLDPLFTDKPFLIYSIAYHASPVHDLVDLLGPVGVRFIHRGPNSYGCQFFNACRSGEPKLKVVGDEVGWYMNETRIAQFYDAYKDDEEINAVDAFLCMHPAATCELFIPFNKPIIIVTTIRYDSGRQRGSQWKLWHRNFEKIVSNPDNLIGANNRYDVQFTKFYFGIEPQLLPSYCGYPRETYTQSRPGFLLGMRRDRSFERYFLEIFRPIVNFLNSSVRLEPIYDVYHNHKWSDLAAHWGIVNLPVQPSLMAVFEQYRMNIPLFFPSKELMLDWEMRGKMMMDEIQSPHIETDWGFRMPPHPTQKDVPDPTGRDQKSAAYWNEFCDWYHLPHVIYYNSIGHLAFILDRMTSVDLWRVSEAMRRYNRRFKGELLAKWRANLRRLALISRRKKSRLMNVTATGSTRRPFRTTPKLKLTTSEKQSTQPFNNTSVK